MKVIQQEVQWGRMAELEIVNDIVFFDTSDGEYGPCELPLSQLEEAIERYKRERDESS